MKRIQYCEFCCEYKSVDFKVTEEQVTEFTQIKTYSGVCPECWTDIDIIE